MDDDAHERDPLLQKRKTPLDLCWTSECLGWLRGLSQSYGHRLLILIFVLLHVQTGFVRILAGKWGTMPYLFKSYNVPAPLVQMCVSVTDSAWVMAPLLALISDTCPIAGYNKAPYVVIFSAIGAGACLVIWLLPPGSLSLPLLMACLFLLLLQIVVCYLTCNGAYVKRVQQQGDAAQGADLQVYVSCGIEACGLVANSVSGPVINGLGPGATYGLAALPAGAAGLVAALGFFEEERVGKEEVAATRQRFWEQGEVCVLALVMFLAVLLTSLLTILSRSLTVNVAGYVVAGAVVVASFSVALSPAVAKMSAFSVLFNAFGLSVEGALFYFYTDSAETFPDGPHLTPYFYNSVRGIVHGCFALVGIYTYRRYARAWSYRQAVLVGRVAYTVALLLTLVLVTRANLALGIPDRLFVVVHTALLSMAYQWQQMPFRVCFMYLCPRHMETTMYALLKGCSDLGGSMSSSLGGLLLSHLGCRPRGAVGDVAHFQHLPLAIVLAAAAGLCGVVPLLHLVPEDQPDKRLAEGADVDATAGSLWEGWMRRGGRLGPGGSLLTGEGGAA